MSLVNYNGEHLSANVPILDIENRSFRYGDGLFESMRVVDGHVVLLERHVQRLVTGMEVLKMKSGPERNAQFWSDMIINLCAENDCLDQARIRLTLYRDAGGHYAPTTSTIAYLIEAERNQTVFSDTEAAGLSIGVYEEIKKPINALGKIKTANSLIYVLAGIAKEQDGMDDMIILNEEGRVTEVISSNIFVVNNGIVRTPALDEGSVAGVTRDWLISKIRERNITVEETKLSLDDVHNADEVFVTNAIQGIRKVSNLGKSTFTDDMIRELSQLKPELDSS